MIGIETDGLFAPSEQKLIANHVPDAGSAIVPPREGHDAFFLEFELISPVLGQGVSRILRVQERCGRSGAEGWV